MASLKEVRNRIVSVKSTQQITSAMKLVAASKLRKAQNSILQLRPFSNKLQEMLQNVSSTAEGSNSVYAEVREPEKVLIIAIASNRGLCGPFNGNIIKAATQLIHEEYAGQMAGGKLDMLTIGRKSTEFFRKNKYPVTASHDELFDGLSYEGTLELSASLMDAYSRKQYDRIVIVYNRFVNAAVQKTTVEQFLPVQQATAKGTTSNIAGDYIFEPQKDQIIQELIPKSLRIQFYKIMLDSFASEHGARMTAMHLATENAKELLRSLQLSYNKARQAAITNEILEIVGGAEALRNS
jgi:F-type H+-transporting ATPase subunit gamma